MTALKEKPPPAEPDGGLIESVVVAQFDGTDNTESKRYCKPVPLRVVVVDLLDKIEGSWLLDKPLHLDGVDLLELHDDFLPLWLSDCRRIMVDSDLAGRWVRDRFRKEGLRPPDIRVRAGR